MVVEGAEFWNGTEAYEVTKKRKNECNRILKRAGIQTGIAGNRERIGLVSEKKKVR